MSASEPMSPSPLKSAVSQVVEMMKFTHVYEPLNP